MGFDFAGADNIASAGNSITRSFGLSGYRAGFQADGFQPEAYQTAQSGVTFSQPTALVSQGLTISRSTNLAS